MGSGLKWTLFRGCNSQGGVVRFFLDCIDQCLLYLTPNPEFWIILFVSMFWLSMFFSGYEITDAKSAHPQFFTSHSALIFQLRKLSREKQQGQSRRTQQPFTTWSFRHSRCIQCLFMYLQDLPSQSWFPVGILFLVCPPRPRHHSSVRHTQTHMHYYNIINLV